MLLLLDNYDSFTYNLAQYFGELGCEVVVRRNDEVDLDEMASLAPDYICISPGPGTPADAGISKDLVLRFGASTPLLGVCLGHQCLAEVYGGKVIPAPELVHGKASVITHTGDDLFANLPKQFEVGRYHSLVVDGDCIPPCLEVTAKSAEGEVMALRHRELPVRGVQFHPESILTRDGKQILANFLALRKTSFS